ncbi:MAG TPA: carbohydrate ABC transporter permease [Spirochaetales bacterium]|nr:carbohydrate ABC transporter permease [Spirochaetales bacterium]
MKTESRFFPIFRVLVVVFLILVAVAALVPFFWAVSSSLKSEEETFSRPFAWIPEAWAWENYIKIFERAPLARNMLNSMYYVCGQLILTLIIVPMAGYVLARKHFPGRDWIFVGILMLMVIPRQATVVHLFVLIKNFPLFGGNNILGQGGRGLVDTFTGLILPRAAEPMSIFIMRQFFWSMPKDLESAAKIDGANEWQTYRSIFLPLATAGMSVVIIFGFENAWNDFLWPLIVLYSKQKFTVQLGLLEFQSDTGALWAQLMAATVVVTVPMIALFLVFQRFFFKGISFEGVTK